MSRQIVNTNGQGLAASSALKFAVISGIVAIVVLLIFFSLDKAGVGDRTAGMSTSTMGAPAPAAT